MIDKSQEGVFKRLLEIAEVAQYDKKEQFVYQESLKDYWDLKSSMETYFMDGKKVQAHETALVLLKNNVDLTIISTSTGLSIEELEKLKSEL